MESLRTIRDTLNLTQLELASLIGVKRITIAQAETGRRLLPLHAWAAIRELQQAIGSTEIHEEAEILYAILHQHALIAAELKEELPEKEKELTQIQYRLQRMQREHALANKTLTAITSERKKLSGNENAINKLEEHYRKAAMAFAETHAIQQDQLIQKIDDLQIRIDYIQTYISSTFPTGS